MKAKMLLTIATIGLAVGLKADVVPGIWNTNFAESLAYAEENNVPIVVVWGNTSCAYCKKLHNVLEDEAIMAWAEEHPIMMVTKHEAFKSTNADYVAAKKWIEKINPKLNGYPYVGVYWKAGETVRCSKAFTGRADSMPVTTPKGDLAKQFANTLDELVGDYEPEEPGPVPPGPEPVVSGDAEFVVKGTTSKDRLEAEPTTEVVYVPVRRNDWEEEAVNKLVVKNPVSSGSVSMTVEWAAGESNKCIAVEMFGSFEEKRALSLTLTDAEGKSLDASSITMVPAQENLPINPHWVGEHTARSLPYGEWTMDFDTAKEKVRLYGGKLVAMFGGPLWCPNCEVIENDVFSTKTFKEWAKREKLVLVHFDQGQASSPSTPEGTPRGRLLTVTQSTKGVSGASYLSRHGINPASDVVASVINRVTELTQQWLPPETAAARLANPVVLLLNKDGTSVDARFQRQGDNVAMDLDENMYRLKDLISLAGDDETKGYRTTTKLELAAGESDDVTFHICSRKFVYRLTDVCADEYVRATVTSNDRDAQTVTLTIMDKGGNAIATGKGKVSTPAPVSEEEAGRLYLMAVAYDDVQSTFYDSATEFNATISVEASEEEPEETVPFITLTKSELKELNNELFVKHSTTVPIYEALNLGGKRLVGTLSVSVTSANKISAKFISEKTVSFAGTWDMINTSTGEVATELEKRVSKVDYELELAMDASGEFSAKILADGETLGSGMAALSDTFLSYAGSYTVTLVDTEEETGTGSLTVKITKAGKATVSCFLPDGTSVSASAVLSPNSDGTVTLPIYKATKKYTVSIALAIQPDAAETWGKQGEMDTVSAVPGCYAAWITDEIVEFEIYGGYWRSTTPVAICENYNLANALDVVIAGSTNDIVWATKTGFKVTKDCLTSLSFTKSMGVFSGKAAVLNSFGRKTTATVKGVLLPGWNNCSACGEEGVNRPYGSGTLYYKEGSKVISKPIDLVAEEEEE